MAGSRRVRPLVVAVALACVAAVVGSGRPVVATGQTEASARNQSSQRWEVVRYDRTLQRRHFGISSDQLVALAEQECRRRDSEAASVARQIDPAKTWRDILQRFERTSHPRTMQDVIPAYEREIKRARAFMVAGNLVSFPFSSELSVEPAPASLVGKVAYAIYFRNEDVLMVALGGGDQADIAEALESHNDGLIAVAAVHEAYPGHRVQNLVKPGGETNEETETFMEGWGLYSEYLMLRGGYYDEGPPEKKLFAVRMLLYRAARAFLDAKVNRGDMSAADAIRFLTERVGLSEKRARVEVEARYLTSPGSAATYLIGMRQILQLRRQVQAREGEAFSLKRFHDRLLAQGMLPVQVIARQGFQMELDTAGILQTEPDAPQATQSAASSARATRTYGLLLGLLIITAPIALYRTRWRGVLRRYNADSSASLEGREE